MKIGTIIENEHGRFAKVLVESDGRFGLSAWVNRKEQAEYEEVVVRFLNSFGLEQVMKKTAKEPKATAPAAPKAAAVTRPPAAPAAPAAPKAPAAK